MGRERPAPLWLTTSGDETATGGPEGFVCLGPLEAFPEGTLVGLTAAGQRLLVVRLGETICALVDRCPHEASRLSRGRREDGTVICPTHGAILDLKTGRMIEPPLGEPEFRRDGQTVPVRVVDGMVWACLEGPGRQRA
ncbi:MAG: Rieske 2Fe-2S domain-containing protein [Deltaproteobacteria bacterium]|nr:Rieske 2Fe-2S domain-containing protein [Deltaproteobacteria bacterium]MBI3077473.1 Rieske 2Fe-2S domain-containing protein [Deltaproteobacteria bacterium]